MLQVIIGKTGGILGAAGASLANAVQQSAKDHSFSCSTIILYDLKDHTTSSYYILPVTRLNPGP